MEPVRLCCLGHFVSVSASASQMVGHTLIIEDRTMTQLMNSSVVSSQKLLGDKKNERDLVITGCGKDIW